MQVKTYIELLEALETGESDIRLMNSISLPNSIHLAKGQNLIADHEDILLSFINGDGIGLGGNNVLKDLAIQTAPSNRAIYLDAIDEDAGTVLMESLRVSGMVQLLMRGATKKLAIKIKGLDIVAADCRRYPERPMKYGVNVYQGALTIYNFNPLKGSEIQVTAEEISIGREMAPVLGSGIFISGFNDEAGPVVVERLTTCDIHSNGMIPTGQPNLITGGIFIVYGAHAKEIVSNGRVVTYGTNDMVLDVWGLVDNWLCREEIVSHGPSGIGFVNFGTVKKFRAQAPIRTLGLGARGFNQYDGTIEEAYFDRIETLGDGSIGMQFSKPVGHITVTQVQTKGSSGETLVKGEIKKLKADAISVLEGGEIDCLTIKGDLRTSGDDVVCYHINGGKVHKLELGGKLLAAGEKSKTVQIEGEGESDQEAIASYL